VNRRAEILREMGIAPLWRWRGRDRGASAGQGRGASAACLTVSAPAETVRSEEMRKAETAAGGASREERIARMDWQELKAAVATCTACGLRAGCKQTVFGVGDEQAEWLLVGEAPGAEEDRLGEPFVGQAGRLLDNMLAAVGLRRGENVYIANVLKCRPPGNRDPEPEEVARCAPHLARQVALIRPKLILAMGRFAAQTLLGTDVAIARLRGRVHRYAGVPLVVTYHPAYLLRNLPDKAKAWADLLFAAKTLGG
jgi:DNA polymerase